MSQIEIIPAIIPQNLNIVRERFSKLVGIVKKVQIDIVDGKYAPPTTWPFNPDQYEELVKMVRGEEKFPYIDEFFLEVDMLVLHPIEYISDLLSIGVKSFVIHVESTDHVNECIEAIKGAKCDVGLAIKPGSDISLLEPYIFHVDFVQFMGNDKVGYNGVELDKKVIEKIEGFHKLHSSIPIQIDIGVSLDTISKLKEVGVTRFISGSAIFTAPDAEVAINQLLNT